MSGAITLVMSEICITSSSAATRGMTFLPVVVAGATMRVVGGGERDDQRGQRLGELMRVGGAVGEQHLGDAVELGGGLGDGAAVLAGDEHVHLAAERLGGGERLGGRRRLRCLLSCSARRSVVIRAPPLRS